MNQNTDFATFMEVYMIVVKHLIINAQGALARKDILVQDVNIATTIPSTPSSKVPMVL